MTGSDNQDDLKDITNLIDQIEGLGFSADDLMAALVARTNGSAEWEEPRPLPGSARVTAWPGGLGGVGDDFVRAVAANTATFPDIAGMCVLAVASTVNAGSMVVNGGPGWYEPAILQLISIADSGEGKTPVMTASVGPLDEIQAAWQAKLKPEIEVAKSQRRMVEVQLKTAEKLASTPPKKDGPAPDDSKMLARRLAHVEVPILPHFYMRDCTPEGFLKEAVGMNGLLAIITDEASGFFENASHYNSKGKSNWDVYLRGYDGLGFTSSRVSRETYDLANIYLPYLLLGQSVVLETLGQDRLAHGLGLFARPLFSLPPTNVGYRVNKRPPIAEDVRAAWADLVIKLVGQARGVAYLNGDITVPSRPDPSADDYEAVASRRHFLKEDTDMIDYHGRSVLGLLAQAQKILDD
jgi:replicative DNA helicase